MNNLLVLIQCKDSVGLVTNITRVLAQHQLNIIAMREFVDEVEQKFFTRIECSGIVENHSSLKLELLNNLPAAADVYLVPKAEKNIALLVTKEFHCLADILVRATFKTLGANVKCIIGNHEILKEFAEKFDIPFFFVSHEDKSKADFENEIASVLSNYQLDYIVLAKFMRILSPDFIAQYSNKIINIHHSFLPAFIGANPYKQAFERGVKIIGATAHFVTNNLDEGPIISQQTIHVNHTLDAKQMAVAGREIEKAVLSKALEQVLEDRVFVSGNKTIVFE
ncbi:formyltetrahydrofolate deformylase [Pedobacter sp. LMG 31464]|uniref:Formyltetrahydrofolate deformylase n=1 Tax=Pedobacter planticolens TaxID=2679964 RepID=A0A923E2C3_9SPHI|nr:formyltetrahydrofolate deformylase [Pedobacter planticolens]MBB2146274.1 formyltetrahydrofolate deformylase [Pedobacter planticolens]